MYIFVHICKCIYMYTYSYGGHDNIAVVIIQELTSCQ